MSYTSVFRRFELKYLLTREQQDRLLCRIEPYMRLDAYGRTTVRNVYYDTDSFRLIRRSIEKPVYKEKLRIRSYARVSGDSTVFVELKKKYNGIVYKRRIALPESAADDWLCDRAACPISTQISREIDYFKSYYGGLRPAMFLSYEREAYYDTDDGSLRVTFDRNVLCRRSALSLREDAFGQPILSDGYVIMEIKSPGAIPLWLVKILSEEKIYKTSFSKYGTAYINTVMPELLEKIKRSNT